MGRRQAAITREEVARTIKGVQDCNLRVVSVQVDDGKLVVNVEPSRSASMAASTKPADFDNLEDYDAWKDARNADRN